MKKLNNKSKGVIWVKSFAVLLFGVLLLAGPSESYPNNSGNKISSREVTMLLYDGGLGDFYPSFLKIMFKSQEACVGMLQRHPEESMHYHCIRLTVLYNEKTGVMTRPSALHFT